MEDATKALEATNGTTLEKNGQILRVAYAKSILGPGSGTSGQSSSLAAAAIEAATFAQQVLYIYICRCVCLFVRVCMFLCIFSFFYSIYLFIHMLSYCVILPVFYWIFRFLCNFLKTSWIGFEVKD